MLFSCSCSLKEAMERSSNALVGIAGGQRRCGASGIARDSEALYRAIAKTDTV